MSLNFDFMKQTFFIALSGIPMTLKLTFISLLLATPFAFFMALCRIYKVRILDKASSVYISFIRGTPLVLQILIAYSLFPSLLNQVFTELNIGINIFELNPSIYAYTVFTLNSIPALSEVFRSALLTVNVGQLEAAYSAGLNSVQAYRRIIIPQALVFALPNICNTAITLLKGTSLAFIMTVKEVTALAKMEAAYGYNYIEAYIDIFIIYIIVCSAIQFIFISVEKRISNYKENKTSKGAKRDAKNIECA